MQGLRVVYHEISHESVVLYSKTDQSCPLTLSFKLSIEIMFLIVLLLPCVKAKRNNLTSATKENMMNKLCDRTLQTARGIGARLCIRDIDISQPMETQRSPLAFRSVEPGQEGKDWNYHDRWLDESKLDCVLLQL